MQEIAHSSSKASEIVVSLFKGSRLIPFFGAGLTKGCRSKNGKVPDASLLTSIITDLASQKHGISAKQIAEIKAIQDLKTAFELLSSDFVKSSQAKVTLGNIFSKVVIAEANKQQLLNLDWPHIFSFNIDDAIENTNSRYKVILPNRNVTREHINANACLFKVHGDINEYISYDDSNVIFTWREYAHSITKNKAMLSFLEEQSKHSALLFIGCSLDAEIDLLHLSSTTKFTNSIYLKCGNLTIREELALKAYGITQVITFDTYDQIYEWLCAILENVKREIPFQDLIIDDSIVIGDEAIKLIANGGPLLSADRDGSRIVKKPQNFVNRALLKLTLEKLRLHECILVTGRRFSGKTMFLFQLIDAVKHLTSNYYASSDLYHPGVRRLVAGADNTMFIFDSNYLNTISLNEIINVDLPSASKLIMCASSGDAEIYRYNLENRNVDFFEINLSSSLDFDEAKGLNHGLTSHGLPNYKQPESLLTFAFRYYDEFKTKLGGSEIFDKQIDNTFFSVMVLVSAFGKAESSHLESIFPYFDASAFINANDRIFEVEYRRDSSDYVIVCNCPAWLINMLGNFIHKNSSSVEIVASLITLLSQKGFDVAAKTLISFDKLNELVSKHNANAFIRGIYLRIQDVYSNDQHYWLQRAKCELISGKTLDDFSFGMSYASKVRLDRSESKNSTYFSATLVMAQLCARSYTLSTDKVFLTQFLEFCLESSKNYDNNKRHMDKFISSYFSKNNDVRVTFDALNSTTDLVFLTRRKDIVELEHFFEMHRSNHKTRN